MGLFKKLFGKKFKTLQERAQALGASVGEVVEAVWEVDANRDKQISGGEVFQLVSVIAGEALKIYGDVDEALREIRTPEGRDAFMAGFKTGFDLADDTKEAAVERILDTLDYNLDTVKIIKDAFGTPTA